MAGPPVPRLLTVGNSVTDGTSFAAASVTPTSGAVLTAWCATLISAGTPNTPTASGTNGLSGTWTAIANSVQDQIKITLFRSTAASAVAGVLTFDLGGQTNSAAIWGIAQWEDVDTTLNVQSKTAVTNAGTTMTFDADPLVAFASDNNGTYACAAASGAFVAVRGNNTQGTMMQLPVSAPNNTEMGGCDFYTPGSTTSPSLGVSGAGSDIVGIAIEVSANGITAGGGGSDTAVPTFRV